ncbi:MAG: hypothetical protein US76_03815 [Parcubacteria group bacterium GW2011_GWA2_38_13b]|nr:MAG: hypothetical protein US76_03815 [Parcubacteria group bacterium GW2011_GWA2_38_13b]
MNEIKYCYLNGKIITVSNAHINLNDMGILRGYGIFDFFRTYNGKAFLLKEHFERFKRSAKILKLKMPISLIQLNNLMKNLLAENKLKECFVRMVLTGGESSDGITCEKPTFFILPENHAKLQNYIYSKGGKLITYDYQRKMPEAKTTDYAIAAMLQNLRKKKKAIEVLYIKNGLILEATMSNFFIFKKNTLITPKNNVLIGITRDFVVKLAKKAKFFVEERDLPLREIKSVSEAFITATTKEIAPIIQINDQKIGNGKIGKNTQILMELFRKYAQNY